MVRTTPLAAQPVLGSVNVVVDRPRSPTPSGTFMPMLELALGFLSDDGQESID